MNIRYLRLFLDEKLYFNDGSTNSVCRDVPGRDIKSCLSSTLKYTKYYNIIYILFLNLDPNS